MDKLEDLLERQKELQLFFGVDLDNMTDDERQQYTKDNILNLLDEAHEILREINWKEWKKTKKPVESERLLEEIVDAFHFFNNICLAWGFSAEEIYQAYIKKDEKIHKRVKEGY